MKFVSAGTTTFQEMSLLRRTSYQKSVEAWLECWHLDTLQNYISRKSISSVNPDICASYNSTGIIIDGSFDRGTKLAGAAAVILDHLGSKSGLL